ncbi:MAG: flagellar export protein FliJ [Planctomycetota bacterium]
MKAFRFSLQRVLQLREQDEDARRRELGEIEQQVARQRHQLGRYQAETEAEWNQFRVLTEQGVMDVQRMINSRSYLLGLKLKVSRVVGRLQELEQERQERIKRYIEARKQKRVLELLRDRSHEKWRREMEAEQQREADDFSTMRHRRDREVS